MYRVRPMSLLDQPFEEDLIRSLPVNKEILNERPNIFLHGEFTPISSGRFGDMELIGMDTGQAGGNIFKDVSRGLKKTLKSVGKFAVKAGKFIKKEKIISRGAKILSTGAALLGQEELVPILSGVSAGASQLGFGSGFTTDVLSPNASEESQVAMGANSYASATLEDALRDPTVRGAVPQ